METPIYPVQSFNSIIVTTHTHNNFSGINDHAGLAAFDMVSSDHCPVFGGVAKNYYNCQKMKKGL